ncbi:MAG TPA: hypothetical protein VJ305_09025, partial [Streptosporangiaceae bacterium]|nr:hypothetical protein [Streptosporangiaceae bacterium]
VEIEVVLHDPRRIRIAQLNARDQLDSGDTAGSRDRVVGCGSWALFASRGRRTPLFFTNDSAGRV